MMSKSKFTPGPWTCEIVGDKCKHLCPAKDGVSILTVALEYKDDEDGPTYFGAVCKPEDARLIAAAPDMYEALTRVIEDVQNMISDGYIGNVMDDVLYIKARAAIAKADSRNE